MGSLDFCANCGDWIGADAGTMRFGDDGEPEIVCAECLAIEQSVAVPISHDAHSGTLEQSWHKERGLDGLYIAT